MNDFEVHQIGGRMILFPPQTRREEVFENGESVVYMDVPGYNCGGTVSQTSLDDIMKYNEWVIQTNSILVPKGTPLLFKDKLSFIGGDMKAICTTNIDVLKIAPFIYNPIRKMLIART